MRNWKKVMMLGLAVTALWAAPVAGATTAECKKACRQAILQCIQACNASPVAGIARGACKTACRRARRPCIQVCTTQLPG